MASASAYPKTTMEAALSQQSLSPMDGAGVRAVAEASVTWPGPDAPGWQTPFPI